MLQFVYDNDEVIAQFIAQIAPPSGGSFGRFKTIGIIDEQGKLLAGLVYFNYDPNSEVMEFGVAATSPRWFNRITYRRIFEYPFMECGCQMIFGRVRADNDHMLGQLAKLNFNLTLVPRMYGRGEDGVLCTLTDDQWLDNALSKRIYRDVKKREAA